MKTKNIKQKKFDKKGLNMNNLSMGQMGEKKEADNAMAAGYVTKIIKNWK